MVKHTDDESRIADLIWRTLKLRISLLVVIIVALLLVWSAMSNGKRQAQGVDQEFCQQLIAEQSKRTPILTLEPAVWCTPQGARNYNEAARFGNDFLLTAWQALGEDESSKEQADRIFQQYKAIKDILDHYDVKRYEAFPLQVQLSSEYSGGSLVLNGRVAAELLPFFAMIVFSIVVVLGFQEAAYRRELQNILRKPGQSAGNHAIAIVRGQFFAGLDSKPHSGVSSLGVLSPERMAIGTLYVLFATCFVFVVVSVISDLVHLTDSILLSYPAAILGAALIFLLLLANTQKRYRALASGVEESKEKAKGWVIRTIQWAVLVFSLVGILSLLFPWTSGADALQGYRFLLRQKGVSQPGGVVQFPIDPSIFRELRPQLTFAVAFVALTAIRAVLYLRRIRSPFNGMTKVQYVMAVVVLFCCVNLLTYMAILQFGSGFAANPWPTLMSIAVEESHEYGAPLLFFDPAYGFLVFLACLVVLIGSSFRSEAFHDSR